MLGCVEMESKGLHSMPVVELVVAAHLHPKSSLSALGSVLPSRANQFQSSLVDKAHRAAALSVRRKRSNEACVNAMYLQMMYQAGLEKEMMSSPDPALREEVCIITDHCLHLHKVVVQAQGRVMGLVDAAGADLLAESHNPVNSGEG